MRICIILHIMKRATAFDFDAARKGFTASGLYAGSVDNSFSKYSPAYSVTNENLRPVTGLKSTKNARVLTIAGSGDSPIFYRIAGAKHVDTFDLSYCAKAVMDIKTAAISVLSYKQYLEMLHELHDTSSVNEVSAFPKIENELSGNVKNFLIGMDGCRIFGNGLRPKNYIEHLPTAEEYSRMQQTIKKPFNFRWADITEVHKTLDTNYDVMNLSNVFQYMNNVEIITNTLESLRPHLTENGMIAVYTTWFIRNSEYDNYVKVQENIKEWAEFKMLKSARQETLILQKLK